MLAVTVSPKFQVVIPQSVREQLGIRPGERLQVLAFGNRIEFPLCQDRSRLRSGRFV